MGFGYVFEPVTYLPKFPVSYSLLLLFGLMETVKLLVEARFICLWFGELLFISFKKRKENFLREYLFLKSLWRHHDTHILLLFF